MAFDRPDSVWGRFRPGDRVGLAGALGQPDGVLDALAAAPKAGRGLTFAGVWLPGVNDRDPSAGVPEARAESIFIPAALREGFAAGRVAHLPLHYSDAHRWVAGPARLGAAVMRVSAPVGGMVTPGLACDFWDAMMASGADLIAEVCPAMPAPPGAPRLPLSRFAAVVEGDGPLLEVETGEVPADLAAVAARIAERIGPGDTVQLGIGKAAAAVLAALGGHRGLRYHAGLVIDAMVECLDTGVFSGGVVTGTAIGTQPLYDRVADEGGIRWASAAHTHSHAVIAATPRFKAINSALEIDLFGQSNGETLRGRQISGTGGSGDFQRGARASEGGEAIVALPATAAGGKVSRIKVGLTPVSIAAIPRADADVVVTEHGVAELRWKDVDARAEALIGVAAPEFRDGLANEWDALRRAL